MNRVIDVLTRLFFLAVATGILLLISRGLPTPGEADDASHQATHRLDVSDGLNSLDYPRREAIAKHLAQRYKQPLPVVRRYVELAWLEADKHPFVEPELVLAVMQKESSLRSHVESSYGAQGLMQVVARKHPEKVANGESLLDPRVNIRVGTRILQEYIQKERKLDKALVKYSGNAKNYAQTVLHEASVLKAIKG